LTKDSRLRSIIISGIESRKDLLKASQLFQLLFHVSNREDIILKLHEKRAGLTNTELLQLAKVSYDFMTVLLQERLSQLSKTEMVMFDEIVDKLPNEMKQNVLIHMYKIRDSLSYVGLVSLLKQSAWEAPSGYKEVLDMLWEGQKRKITYSRNHPFTISVPQGVQCIPSLPVSAMAFFEDLPRQQPYRQSPLHLFSPIDDSNYFIEITDLASLLYKPNSKFDITLIKPIQNSSVVIGIYLSSPQSPQPKVLVGHISDSQPCFQLKYPLPKLGPLSFVRIELSFRCLEEISAELPKENVSGDVGLTMENSKVVVCVGDIHQFDVHKDETMGQFLQRACRKWNVNYTEYEIQDMNFQTHPDNTKFSEYNAKGGSHVVRLVKKPTQGTPPFQVPQHGLTHFGGAQAQATVHPWGKEIKFD